MAPAAFPDARFVEPWRSRVHLVRAGRPWTRSLLAAIQQFLTGARGPPRPVSDRASTTILFTDIVGSTPPRRRDG